MAKDHGREFLYKPMKDCARLLHWHIVTLMTQRSVVQSPMTEYVDWLVLLERYLRHPAATPPAAQSVPSTIPTAIRHVTKAADSLVSLARSYGRTALDPLNCTWEAIADANFDTAGLKAEERALILQQELGSDATTGFALPPGLTLLIPDQPLALGMAAGSAWNHRCAVVCHGLSGRLGRIHRRKSGDRPVGGTEDSGAATFDDRAATSPAHCRCDKTKTKAGTGLHAPECGSDDRGCTINLACRGREGSRNDRLDQQGGRDGPQ